MTASMGAGFVTAYIVALVAIGVVRGSSLARLLVDRPNERSLHVNPTPRVGGIGLLAGAMPVCLALASTEGQAIAGMAIVLAIVSAMDDANSLPVSVRLSLHAAVAVIAVVAIGPYVPQGPAGGLVAACAAAIAIVWMANLFNFMDGADGLAGAMAAIGFATLGVAAHRAGAAQLSVMAGAVSLASLAFLAWNFPPAKVFLGDAGSVPLGFLAGALGWQGVVLGAWPVWFPVLAFSPFVADASVTLFRRVLAGETVWRAHRSHYYQRLVLGGWSHRRLALVQAAIMASAGASALVALDRPAWLQSGILVVWLLAYFAMAVAIDRKHPRDPG